MKIDKKDLAGLSAEHRTFVREYMKDFKPRRAAQAAGFHPDRGYQLLERDDVRKAIEFIVIRDTGQEIIDVEWLTMELADNHRIARQTGQLSASNTALKTLAQLSTIDALAKQRVDHTSSDGSMTPAPTLTPEAIKKISKALDDEC